ncbi:hypothetical protein BCR32DRAFT_277158 [Anaeromyces robustus]|uniref:L domain-like protein n=1 Tax=Anaeromyces robustus TaxID=1754192 RepID=A0A1Y1XF98_9FUNG|nr:hypothetical protein BCR32DRAFT_277158 [Anaeromyces robustus]|eukprot:ORX84362.1 hypothetical protein BCR32DRAFT_277158 [Anaeromyces robustus]
MKLFLFIILLFSILTLINTSEIEECKIYYSIVGPYNKNCHNDVKSSSSISENDHIISLQLNGAVHNNDKKELKKIKEIGLNGNNIIKLSEEFFTLKELRVLNLNNNDIEKHSSSNENFTELKSLKLDGNKIKERSQSKLKDSEQSLIISKILSAITLFCIIILI